MIVLPHSADAFVTGRCAHGCFISGIRVGNALVYADLGSLKMPGSAPDHAQGKGRL